MSNSLPSPWRLFRVRLLRDTCLLGKGWPPLVDDIERRTSLRGELIVAMYGQRAEYVSDLVDEFKEGGFLNFGHCVRRFSVE